MTSGSPSPAIRRPTACPHWSWSDCWWARSFSGVARAWRRRKLGRTLVLLLLLAVGQVTLLQAVPAQAMPRSFSSSTSHQATPTGSFRFLAALCDSQETTTDPASPPSTVGTPCEPTDVAANQTEYLGLVGLALVLFGLFFLIGIKLWR